MAKNPFKDSTRKTRRASADSFLDLGVVRQVDADSSHTVLVEILSTGGSSGPVVASASVPQHGDINVPEVGTLVAVGRVKGRRPVILGTLYSSDADVPSYNAGDRRIGHDSTQAQFKIDEDGTVRIDSETGQPVLINGEQPSTGDAYTDEDAQDAVGTILSGDFTYDDVGNAINMDPHATDASAHHTRYTDSEAVSAVESASALNLSGRVTIGNTQNRQLIIDWTSGASSSWTWQSLYENGVEKWRLVGISSGDLEIWDESDNTVLTFHQGGVIEPEDTVELSTAELEKTFSHSGSQSPYALFSGDPPPSSRLPAGQTAATLMTGNVYDQNVHAQSDNSGLLTYDQAVEYAEERGGRLPTLEEVEGMVTAGSGSGYDNEIIWTQTRAGPEEVYAQYGKWDNFTTDPRTTRTTLSTDGTDTAVVRWVAEADQDGLPASVDYARDQILVATGSSTNINASNDVAWTTTDVSDSAYSFDGTTVTIQEAGWYHIEAHADFNSTNARTNPNIGIRKNSSEWIGVIGRSGYMRNASGHNNSSVHTFATVNLSANDTIHIRGIQEAASENISPNRAQFFIRQIPR